MNNKGKKIVLQEITLICLALFFQSCSSHSSRINELRLDLLVVYGGDSSIARLQAEGLEINSVTKAIKNVVIELIPAEKSQPEKTSLKDIEINIVNHAFLPRIIVAEIGQTIKFTNSMVKHATNLKIQSEENECADINLGPGKSFNYVPTRAGIIRAESGIVHSARAFIVVVEDLRWIRVSNGDDMVSWNDLSPGIYTIRMFHEVLGEKRITLKLDQVKTELTVSWSI